MLGVNKYAYKSKTAIQSRSSLEKHRSLDTIHVHIWGNSFSRKHPFCREEKEWSGPLFPPFLLWFPFGWKRRKINQATRIWFWQFLQSITFPPYRKCSTYIYQEAEYRRKPTFQIYSFRALFLFVELEECAVHRKHFICTLHKCT